MSPKWKHQIKKKYMPEFCKRKQTKNKNNNNSDVWWSWLVFFFVFSFVCLGFLFLKLAECKLLFCVCVCVYNGRIQCKKNNRHHQHTDINHKEKESRTPKNLCFFSKENSPENFCFFSFEKQQKFLYKERINSRIPNQR